MLSLDIKKTQHRSKTELDEKNNLILQVSEGTMRVAAKYFLYVKYKQHGCIVYK